MLRDPAGVRTTAEVEGGCLRETGCGRAQTAKLDYGMIARFFSLVFPRPEAWNMFQSVSCDYFCVAFHI